MLRRDFIKSTSLALGGVMLTGNIVMAEMKKNKANISKNNKRLYRLHGNARFGCASAPPYIDMIEYGFSNLPL